MNTGIRCVFKYEIATVLGVSRETLRKYMHQSLLYEKLKLTDYKNNQKVISPAQLNIICEHFCISITEFKPRNTIKHNY